MRAALVLSLLTQSCWSDSEQATLPYTGAWLASPFAQRYGAFEARIWLAAAPGGRIADWPAFWLVGPGWPAGGEIDVMEGLGGTDCQTYHYGTPADRQHRRAAPWCTTARPDTWNTYGVRWQPGSITWYLNGRQSGVLRLTTTTAAMQLVLDYTTARGSAVTSVPAAMKVAYARAWTSP